MRQWRMVEDFPNLNYCHDNGIIAFGGSYHPERLISAYKKGIFPWPSDPEDYIPWHCPRERFVLQTDRLHLSKSLKKVSRKEPFHFTLDKAFRKVIESCAGVSRPNNAGTWINDELIEGYCALYEMGYAHSVEAWEGDELVGGLYGVAIGRMFYGESMFSLRSNASKLAFARFVIWLKSKGFPLIDCQAYTHYLASFGAETIPRALFLERLAELTMKPNLASPWRFDET